MCFYALPRLDSDPAPDLYTQKATSSELRTPVLSSFMTDVYQASVASLVVLSKLLSANLGKSGLGSKGIWDSILTIIQQAVKAISSIHIFLSIFPWPNK